MGAIYALCTWAVSCFRPQARPTRGSPKRSPLSLEALEQRLVLSTLQSFDGGGSAFAVYQNDKPPAPMEIAGGPTGDFLRLAYATTNPANVNTLSFARTDVGAFDQVIADFDFRITPGDAAGAAGRADGFGFALLKTSFWGTGVDNAAGGSEEPNFAASLGVGFDIYQNDDLGDIGNDFVRPNYSNSVSIHFNGAVLPNGQFDATPIVDLASGEWIHAKIVMRPGGGFSDVSVILTPSGGSPLTLVDRFPVSGFTPYDARVQFGARSGGESANHDLDNIRVDFSNFPNLSAGLLEFSSANFTVNESGPTAQVTVTRKRGSTGTVSVQYSTADISATSGADYAPTTGMLTFPAGDTSPKTITVPIRDDSDAEPAERFRVSLTNPTGGSVLGVASEATVTILDNDGTVQDFDAPNTGTPYVEAEHAPPPTAGPVVVDGGPTGIGKFIRLASQITDDRANHNSITFNSTDDVAHNLVVADFDFRMTPRTSRADGLGFALLSTSTFGTIGPVAPQEPFFAAEEPNFANSLGVGFDIFNNNCDGCPPHPDDNINELAIHNIISLHFNGVLLTQVDATPVVDLANGQWIHARVTIQKTPNRPFAVVSVALNPCNGSVPVNLIDNYEVSGLVPYVSRAWIGARSGGFSANHDLDNINIKFLDLSQSIVSLSASSYTAAEGGSAALITANRSGSTSGTTTVQFMTENVTAQAGVDYTATSGTLVFDPGETRKSFSVPILDDTNQEADQVFKVSLQNPSPAAVLGGPFIASVKIFDDETSALVGHWSSVACTSVAAVHASLLPNGRIMYWDRVGEIRSLDPVTMTITSPANPGQDNFCGGQSFLGSGELMVTGGHEHGGGPEHDGEGLKTAVIYNYVTDTWDTSLPLMNDGRWYPTNTTLGTGEVLVLSGSTQVVNGNYIHNPLPQIWEPSTRTWRDLTVAGMEQLNAAAGNQPLGVDLYPRLFLAPDGRVFKVGPDKKTWFLDTTGLGHWTPGPPSNLGLRTYGAAVMYAPGKILIVGGGQATSPNPALHATATAEVIDLNLPNPTWRTVAPMAFARRQLNATVLPDGQVLVTGGTGGPGFNNEANPVLPAEVWDPDTETWTTLPAMQVTRGYHSVAFALPDGRVFSAGGGQGANALSFYNIAEFYSPSYLFVGPQPTITSAPSAATYGESFFVGTPEAASISKASLIRLPSVTHSFDQNGRFIGLIPTHEPDGVMLTVPSSANIVPPGHYMLFVLNDLGVPSVARIIQITGGGRLNQSGGGTAVTEDGATDSYTLELTSQPTTDVTVAVMPDSQLSVDVSTLTFTPDNWNIPQTIRVMAVDDAVAEGNHTGTISHIATSADPVYNGASIESITATISDNDQGIIVTPTAGLTTTERGGTATFTIVLATAPAANVTIGLSSSNTAEGTVSPALVTFTPQDALTPQTVTITGIDDFVVDGPIAYMIVTSAAVSSDPGYAGLNAPDVSATNSDNDTAGIAISQTGGVTSVTEGGVTDTYAVVLTSQPTANVTITVTPDSQVLLAPRTPIFTPDNWNSPQSIIVTAVDDCRSEGTHMGMITHSATSADANYDSLMILLTATISDNDLPLRVQFSSVGYVAGEALGRTSITVCLTTPPSKVVSVAFGTSNGSARAGRDYVRARGRLVFRPGEVNKAFLVTIRNDRVNEPDETVHLKLSRPKSAMLGNPSAATLTILDDDPSANPAIGAAVFIADAVGTPSTVPTLSLISNFNRADGELRAIDDTGPRSPRRITVPGPVAEGRWDGIRMLHGARDHIFDDIFEELFAA